MGLQALSIIRLHGKQIYLSFIAVGSWISMMTYFQID